MSRRPVAQSLLESITVPPSTLEVALGRALDRMGAHRVEDGPQEGHALPARLARAMRHAVLGGGKRLRPALVFAGAASVGAPPTDALVAACAVEMIHAYSLVHDDLPTLDNDETRRGRPACHVAFGEPTALLAGDALLTEALGLLADGQPLNNEPRPEPDRRVRAVVMLARSVGAAGMVGGQHDDLEGSEATPALDRKWRESSERREVDRPGEPLAQKLVAVHRRKTGRLIQVSAVLGALYTRGADEDLRVLGDFGADVGLAFQLVDDVLDADGLAALWGNERARQHAHELTDSALAYLDRFGPQAEPLRRIANTMLARTS